jgi:hypothetical protein
MYTHAIGSQMSRLEQAINQFVDKNADHDVRTDMTSCQTDSRVSMIDTSMATQRELETIQQKLKDAYDKKKAALRQGHKVLKRIGKKDVAVSQPRQFTL